MCGSRATEEIDERALASTFVLFADALSIAADQPVSDDKGNRENTRAMDSGARKNNYLDVNIDATF